MWKQCKKMTNPTAAQDCGAIHHSGDNVGHKLPKKKISPFFSLNVTGSDDSRMHFRTETSKRK